MAAMAIFKEGDEVEVCSKEEGFLGSYYEAKVVSKPDDNFLKVQYKNLVEEDDHSRRLVEIVTADEVRPVPPKSAEKVKRFFYLQKVDAFDNDGWWVGKITGKKGLDYWVYFETTGDEIAYPVSRLRSHLDWRLGLWVSPKENLF